jgi:hypothetical protein
LDDANDQGTSAAQTDRGRKSGVQLRKFAGLPGGVLMKRHVFLSTFFVLTSVLFYAQGTPIRPGIRQADQAESQTEKNIPPPSNAQAKVDLAKVGKEADELARLAQTIPSDVASIQNGMLPKDVLQKLRQIEKLTKRLRSELEH